MSEKGLAQKVLGGAAWVLLEQFCVQGLNFALGMILARLLTPQDYGSVAVVMVFLNVAMVLVGSGFGQALIRKKNADDLDFSSVFYVSVMIASVAYAALFAFSPWIADFYRMPELKGVLRVLGANLIFYAINSVQSAELLKEMRFDLVLRVSLITAMTSAVVGVSLAFFGGGVWALVWSSSLSSVAGVVARWFFVRWKPRLEFSLARVKPLYAFGWKLMVSQLMYVGMNNLYGFVIGRMYSGASLAYVNKANNFPELIKNNLNVALIEVSYPALSKMNDDLPRLRNSIRRLLKVNVATVAPVMVLLALTAHDCILLLYGRQWLPCVPYMRLFCVGAAIACLGGVNIQAATALGRSDVVLKMMVVKSGLALLLICAVLPFGILEWTASMALAYWPIVTLIDMLIGRSTVKYELSCQALDVLPTVLAFALACGGGMLLGLPIRGDSVCCLILRLMTVWGGSGLVYAFLLIAFKLDIAKEFLSLGARRFPSRFSAFRFLLAYVGVADVSNERRD